MPGLFSISLLVNTSATKGLSCVHKFVFPGFRIFLFGFFFRLGKQTFYTCLINHKPSLKNKIGVTGLELCWEGVEIIEAIAVLVLLREDDTLALAKMSGERSGLPTCGEVGLVPEATTNIY